MERLRLLGAFLAVCIAAAGADPEPISTPFIPCKVLPPLKALNLQQVNLARDVLMECVSKEGVNIVEISLPKLPFSKEKARL
jgi:hypothetical protein